MNFIHINTHEDLLKVKNNINNLFLFLTFESCPICLDQLEVLEKNKLLLQNKIFLVDVSKLIIEKGLEFVLEEHKLKGVPVWKTFDNEGNVNKTIVGFLSIESIINLLNEIK